METGVVVSLHAGLIQKRKMEQGHDDDWAGTRDRRGERRKKEGMASEKASMILCPLTSFFFSLSFLSFFLPWDLRTQEWLGG